MLGGTGERGRRQRRKDEGGILKGDFLEFFVYMYDIQHCCISRPVDSTVSEDAGIEPRTVALAVRRSNHSARSHSLLGQISSTLGQISSTLTQWMRSSRVWMRFSRSQMRSCREKEVIKNEKRKKQKCEKERKGVEEVQADLACQLVSFSTFFFMLFTQILL